MVKKAWSRRLHNLIKLCECDCTHTAYLIVKLYPGTFKLWKRLCFLQYIKMMSDSTMTDTIIMNINAPTVAPAITLTSIVSAWGIERLIVLTMNME